MRAHFLSLPPPSPSSLPPPSLSFLPPPSPSSLSFPSSPSSLPPSHQCAANCSLITSDPHLHTKGSGEVGTSVRFTCDFGYVLNGSETLTCDSSIIWSGPFPSCTEGSLQY